MKTKHFSLGGKKEEERNNKRRTKRKHDIIQPALARHNTSYKSILFPIKRSLLIKLRHNAIMPCRKKVHMRKVIVDKRGIANIQVKC